MDVLYLSKESSDVSWGFRLQGGADFSQKLTVQRVTPGGLAAKASLQPGDTIMKIGDVETKQLLHQQAHDLISKATAELQLTIVRRGAPCGPLYPTGTGTGQYGMPQYQISEQPLSPTSNISARQSFLHPPSTRLLELQQRNSEAREPTAVPHNPNGHTSWQPKAGSSPPWQQQLLWNDRTVGPQEERSDTQWQQQAKSTAAWQQSTPTSAAWPATMPGGTTSNLTASGATKLSSFPSAHAQTTSGTNSLHQTSLFLPSPIWQLSTALRHSSNAGPSHSSPLSPTSPATTSQVWRQQAEIVPSHDSSHTSVRANVADVSDDYQMAPRSSAWQRASERQQQTLPNALPMSPTAMYARSLNGQQPKSTAFIYEVASPLCSASPETRGRLPATYTNAAVVSPMDKVQSPPWQSQRSNSPASSGSLNSAQLSPRATWKQTSPPPVNGEANMKGYMLQADGTVTSVQWVDRPVQDMQRSAVLAALKEEQEVRAGGALGRRRSSSSNKHGLSFKVLQWITGTAEDDEAMAKAADELSSPTSPTGGTTLTGYDTNGDEAFTENCTPSPATAANEGRLSDSKPSASGLLMLALPGNEAARTTASSHMSKVIIKEDAAKRSFSATIQLENQKTAQQGYTDF